MIHNSRRTNADRQCVLEGECRPVHRSKKDKHRWCKGKVGREHQWVWTDMRELWKVTTRFTSARQVMSQGQRCSFCLQQRSNGKHYRRIHLVGGCGGLMVKIGMVTRQDTFYPQMTVIEPVRECETCHTQVVGGRSFFD